MMTSKPPSTLDGKTLHNAVAELCSLDDDLAQVVEMYGPPPLWDREAGFPTLIHIILEQQVSLASARAAFIKLQDASGKVTPERFRQFSDAELKSIGFSRQKTRYGRELSHAIINGELDLGAFHTLSDAEVRQQLTKIKGIGMWTADIYLLMGLLRADIWPRGDLALAKGLQKLKNLPELPSTEHQIEIARGWAPWRSAAARIVWHYYLSES
jgi:DNA-3-methyladenine glycosylase II